MGSQEPTPHIFLQMKSKYRTPSTTLVALKSGILCVSGPIGIAPRGQLESIEKTTGEW
jgi:hypothetical protein